MNNASSMDKAVLNAMEAAFKTSFKGVAKLCPDNGAPVWIDGATSPPSVVNKAPDHKTATCSFHAASDVLVRVLSGERALENALVSGRLRISGDMGVMSAIQLSASR